jgi:catechol 2,3-dioxygenase-like lactoylglutathione lyase family enzyme
MDHPYIRQAVTFLYTQDLEATSRFYQETLDLELTLDQGPCRIYQVSRDSFLGFCKREEVTSDHSDVIFTFVTPEVDSWYSYLKDKGIEIEKPPAHNPTYNIYHMFLRDPNGYLLEIQEFLDPAWPK